MENKEKGKSGVKFGIIALVLFLAIGFGVYFCYWVQRPMYAAEQICIAVNTGDTMLFEKYVDLQNVYGKAYDQYSEILVQEQSARLKDPKWLPRKLSGKMAVSVLRTFKPEIVATLKDITLNNIAKKNEKNTTRPKPKQGLPELFVKLLDTVAEENDLKNLDVVNYDVTKVSDTVAEGEVHFKSRVKETPFILKFRMERTSNTNWRVTEITNLTQIISRIEKNPINVEDLL